MLNSGLTDGESQQQVRSATSDADGLMEIELLRGCSYREYNANSPKIYIEYTVDDDAAMELPGVLDGA